MISEYEATQTLKEVTVHSVAKNEKRRKMSTTLTTFECIRTDEMP
jgi:hypothetical protein